MELGPTDSVGGVEPKSDDSELHMNDELNRSMFGSGLYRACLACPCMLLWPRMYQTVGKEQNQSDTPKEEPESTSQLQTTERLGGWKSIPYILGSEFCERIAATALAFNFISYLQGQYHMHLVTAATLISISVGTSSIMPLFGAIFSDAYLGRFWTIILGAFSNLVGSFLLCTSAFADSLRPAPGQHATIGQWLFLCTALLFTAIGAGGVRPCTSAFGADQFEPEDKKALTSFFNWFFFSLSTAALLGVTVVVYIQDHAGWTWGFSVPCFLIVLAIIALFLGISRYKFVSAKGSPFTALAQVITAAFYKRNLTLPSDPAKLHGNSPSDQRKRLPHTGGRLKWLDHAAIVSLNDFNGDGSVKNKWRLSTAHQTEELKILVRLAPIWLIDMLAASVVSEHAAFNVPQAKTMDRHLGRSFQVPPASMTLFASISLMLWLPIYDKVLVPFMRRRTRNPRGIPLLQRIGIGFCISISAMIVAALVESKRRKIANQSDLADKPLSVFWLVPQQFLYGLSEVFRGVGQYELLYEQVPDGMKATASGLYWLSVGLGSYTGAIILQLVHRLTGRGGRDWLADNLNQGHLDYFFYLLAILQFANLLVFLAIARGFVYKSYDGDSTKTQNPEKKVQSERTLPLAAD